MLKSSSHTGFLQPPAMGKTTTATGNEMDVIQAMLAQYELQARIGQLRQSFLGYQNSSQLVTNLSSLLSLQSVLDRLPKTVETTPYKPYHQNAITMQQPFGCQNLQQLQTGLSMSNVFPMIDSKQQIQFADCGLKRKDITSSDIPQPAPVKRRRKRRKAQSCSSKYRGVSWHKRDRRWVARAWVDGKTHNLGTFISEKEAAIAVDKRLIESYGPVADMLLNFPDPKDRVLDAKDEEEKNCSKSSPKSGSKRSDCSSGCSSETDSTSGTDANPSSP